MVMKKTIYNQYYKLGFEHYINKYVLGLSKPDIKTDVFYFGLMAAIVLVANLI